MVSPRFFPADEIVSRGVARWPGLELSLSLVEQALASARGGREGVRYPEEFFLAIACAAGDPAALREFDNSYLQDAVRTAARLDPASPQFADELAQVIRERLFLPREGRARRIAEYEGDVALLAWLRVVGNHCAIDLLRARPKPLADLEEHLDRLVSPGTPEFAFIEQRFRADFKRAFNAAVQSLSPRERGALRLRLAERVPLEDIAVIYRVHRSSVTRWLAAARATVLERTRQNLSKILGASHSEISSILRVARSQLDVSLSAAFRSAKEPGA